MCAGSCRKSGTIGVPGRVHPGRGTKGLKSGTSRIIRDGWQPYLCVGAGLLKKLWMNYCEIFSKRQEPDE